jgi:hypothetical protein
MPMRWESDFRIRRGNEMQEVFAVIYVIEIRPIIEGPACKNNTEGR